MNHRVEVSRVIELLVIGLITVAGVYLRTIDLTRSVWADEMITLQTLQVNIFKNPLFFNVSSNLPGYYYFLKLWAFWFGQKLVVLRLASFFANLLTLLVGTLYLKRHYTPMIAFVFAAIFAFSPLQIHYATELRAYALVQLFLGLHSLFLLEYLSTGHKSKLKASMVFGGLALATHLVAAAVLCAELGVLLLSSKSKVHKKAVVSLAWLILLFVGFFFIFSSNPSLAKSYQDLELSRALRPSVFMEDLVRLKEVLTFYFWFGLHYYYVDWAIQFGFKKIIFVVVFGLSLVYFSRTRDAKLAFVGLVTLSSLIGLVGLENLGLYPFGGRHIMPLSFLYYLYFSVVVGKACERVKLLVMVPVLMCVLFFLFGVMLPCAHSSKLVPDATVALYKACVFN